MNAMQPSVDIVVPFFDPPEGWVTIIRRQFAELEGALDMELGLILVDDGSRGDATSELDVLDGVIDRLTIIRLDKNSGKGAALRAGVERSQAPIIVYTDVDFPYTTHSMTQMVQSLREDHADVAIGVREADYYARIPRLRRYVSRLLRHVNRWLFDLKVDDTQCGLKGFNAYGRRLFLQTSIRRYVFDIEFVRIVSHDPNCRLSTTHVELRPEIRLSTLRLSSLMSEAIDLFRLFFS